MIPLRPSWPNGKSARTRCSICRRRPADRDSAAQIVGHERGFTFRVYNPEGIDVAGLREVVEAVRYEGLTLPRMTRGA